MTTPTPPQAAAGSGHEEENPPAPATPPEPFAVSPAIGPLPAIYVPSAAEQASTGDPLSPVIASAARLAAHWAVAHHPPTGGAMSDFPADLRYSRDHLWARLDAEHNVVRSGVTDFAQQSLGDVVDVTLPRLGEWVKAGQACGDIESVKSVNDLVAPITGTIRARNDALTSAPGLVNSDPYGQGWMFEAEAEADPATVSEQLASLMDAHAYRDLVGE